VGVRFGNRDPGCDIVGEADLAPYRRNHRPRVETCRMGFLRQPVNVGLLPQGSGTDRG